MQIRVCFNLDAASASHNNRIASFGASVRSDDDDVDVDVDVNDAAVVVAPDAKARLFGNDAAAAVVDDDDDVVDVVATDVDDVASSAVVDAFATNARMLTNETLSND